MTLKNSIKTSRCSTRYQKPPIRQEENKNSFCR